MGNIFYCCLKRKSSCNQLLYSNQNVVYTSNICYLEVISGINDEQIEIDKDQELYLISHEVDKVMVILPNSNGKIGYINQKDIHQR